MKRLMISVVCLLIVVFVGLYFCLERPIMMRTLGDFFHEYVEGVAPWLVIVLLVAACRRALKRLRRPPPDARAL